MGEDLLRIGHAARLYDIPARAPVEAWYYRRIDFRDIDDLIFLPRKAVEEFKRQREQQGVSEGVEW